MGTLRVVKPYVARYALAKLFLRAVLDLYSSSLFIDEKNDSATELSYGEPGLENDWVTPRSARKARKVQER